MYRRYQRSCPQLRHELTHITGFPFFVFPADLATLISGTLLPELEIVPVLLMALLVITSSLISPILSDRSEPLSSFFDLPVAFLGRGIFGGATFSDGTFAARVSCRLPCALYSSRSSRTQERIGRARVPIGGGASFPPGCNADAEFAYDRLALYPAVPVDAISRWALGNGWLPRPAFRRSFSPSLLSGRRQRDHVVMEQVGHSARFDEA